MPAADAGPPAECGSAPVARLVIESPDGEWMAEAFAATGALYKAESTGDYRYRGDDPLAYDEVFDQEAGDNNADNLALKCAAVRRWIAQLGSFARVVDGVVSRPVRSVARGG